MIFIDIFYSCNYMVHRSKSGANVMKNRIQSPLIALVLLAMLISKLQSSTAYAQGTTAFTYQGQLRDSGTNANGPYTMIFNLYDSPSGDNLIGGPITTTATMANGLFTVNLDFGAGAFNGSARYLDITVQSGSDSEELTPRVQVLPAPYAIFANTANIANNLDVTSGSVSLSQSFPPYGTSSWNVENGFSESIVGIYSDFESSLFFTGNSGLPALQIFDDPEAGLRGISATSVLASNVIGNSVTASNFYGGTFYGSAGNQSNLLNVIPNMQLFSNSGTFKFIVPSNVTRIMAELWGGGGGGGSGVGGIDSNGDGANQGPGAGGGGGAYGKGVWNVTPGQTLTVVVGAGGIGGSDGGGATSGGDSSVTSSLGSAIAGGGAAGGSFIWGSGESPNGGIGGNSTSIPWVIPGTAGGIGQWGGNAGNGGSSAHGSGGAAISGGPGSPGTSPGGGGAGGSSNGPYGGLAGPTYSNNTDGGGGGSGCVILYY